MNNATTQQIRELAGTEVKVNVSATFSGVEDMDSCDFECLFYPRLNGVGNIRRGVSVHKGGMVRVDASNYVALVDTSVTGPGELMCRLKAEIPDADFPDGVRTEIMEGPTGIVTY